MKEQKWVTLPIDIKCREFKSKILIAYLLAQNNFNVIIGDAIKINSLLESLPKGIYFDKAVGIGKQKKYKKLIDNGSKVVAHDEEGLVYTSKDVYCNFRISDDTIKMTEKMFLWGENQHSDILDIYNHLKDRIAITGNPRFDILKPEFRSIYENKINEITDRYGDFILVNTRFAQANHYKGETFLLNRNLKNGKIKNKKDEEYYRSNIEFQKKLIQYFKEMILKISEEYKDYNIIIRPHPSENQDTYKAYFKKYENIFVEFDDDVIPWLLGSKATIHNSCTTAVESYVLKKMSLSYIPIESELGLNYYLPNALSVIATNLDEVIMRLQEIIDYNQQFNTREIEEIAAYYIDCYDEGYATKKIVNEIKKIKVSEDHLSFKNAMHIKFYSLKVILKSIVKRILSISNFKYRNQVFQKISKKEIHQMFDIFEGIFSDSSKDVTVKKICNDIYYITIK